ncbi:hypothetical protein ACFLQ0_04810 [Nitrospinota bacterium]
MSGIELAALAAVLIAGPVHAVCLAMFLWPKEIFIFIVNAFHFAGSVSLMGALSLRGEYPPQVLAQIGLALIPIFAGFYVGVQLRSRISQEVFYRIVRAVLFLIATSLVVRSVRNLVCSGT